MDYLIKSSSQFNEEATTTIPSDVKKKKKWRTKSKYSVQSYIANKQEVDSNPSCLISGHMLLTNLQQ